MRHNILNEALKGFIEFNPLKFDEKQNYAIQLSSYKNNDELTEDQNAINSMLFVAKVYSTVFQNQVTSIDIEIIADGDYKGMKINNYDDLITFQEGVFEVNTLAGKIVNGLMLGKPKLKDSEEIAP